MLSTPIGLGDSPGWTKTQATEPADHNPFNRLNPERCFLPYISPNNPWSGNKKPSNAKYYSLCHRVVNKDLVTLVNQMSQPIRLTATYPTPTSLQPKSQNTPGFFKQNQETEDDN